MTAIILAAGTSSRMAPVSRRRPKCLLDLHGKPLLLHQLDLLTACGIRDVTVVTGFASDQVAAVAGGRARLEYYPEFRHTNNLATLHHCRALLATDVIVLFGDVLLPRASLQRLVGSGDDFGLLVDTSQCREGTMRIRLRDGLVSDIGPHIPAADGHGNFIGIARYSASGARSLAAELGVMRHAAGFRHAYYTAALPRLAATGHRIAAIPLDGSPWLELDVPEDYLAARDADFYLV